MQSIKDNENFFFITKKYKYFNDCISLREMQEETDLFVSNYAPEKNIPIEIRKIIGLFLNSKCGTVSSQIAIETELIFHERQDFFLKPSDMDWLNENLENLLNDLGFSCQYLTFKNRKAIHDFWKYLADSSNWCFIIPLLQSENVIQEIEEDGDEEWILLFTQIKILYSDSQNEIQADAIEPAVTTLIKLLFRFCF